MQVRESKGLYSVQKASAEDLLALAASIIEQGMLREALLNRPEDVMAFLKARLALQKVECMCILHLDNRLRVLKFEELCRGTISATAVYPREVVRSVISANSSAVVLVHNHPSGSPQPSTEDRLLTDRLIQALRTIDVRVVDHIIVAGNETVSMATLGMM